MEDVARKIANEFEDGGEADGIKRIAQGAIGWVQFVMCFAFSRIPDGLATYQVERRQSVVVAQAVEYQELPGDRKQNRLSGPRLIVTDIFPLRLSVEDVTQAAHTNC